MEVTSVTGRSPRGEQQAAYRGVEASSLAFHRRRV
jgi:hypothetical protein